MRSVYGRSGALFDQGLSPPPEVHETYHQVRVKLISGAITSGQNNSRQNRKGRILPVNDDWWTGS